MPGREFIDEMVRDSAALINAGARIGELTESLREMDSELVETRTAVYDAKRTIAYLNARLNKLNHAPSWATAWCCAACEPDAREPQP